ncbi:MAG: hypothetical protein ACLUHE_16375 [Christensenellales bacterium]
MKHPVWDRILILLCALIALGCAASVVVLLIGKISFGHDYGLDCFGGYEPFRR